MIYLDTSSFLALMFGQADHARVRATLATHHGPIVSSRLLALECRRFQVREGRSWADFEERLRTIDLLPVDESVLSAAFDIGVHVKTLDALHLGTCRIVGAHLLTSDKLMASAAQELGLACA